MGHLQDTTGCQCTNGGHKTISSQHAGSQFSVELLHKQVAGKSVQQWIQSHPLLENLMCLQETSWFNPDLPSLDRGLAQTGLTISDIDAAAQDRKSVV